MDLAIRMATPDDAAACLSIYAPVIEQTAISFELAPPTSAEMAERIRKSLAHSLWIVAQDKQGVCGYAYDSQYRARAAYDWTAEVSVYIHDRCRGRGVGTRLYEVLLGALRRLGFRTVIAGATLPNEASKRLHESMGFVDAGRVHDAGWKFNRWHDVGFWQLRLGDGSAPRRPYAAADLTESDRAALLGERWESPARG